MCSSTRGPATVPSLVTCPTMKMEMPLLFASRRKTPVDSRTWETLPGAEDTHCSRCGERLLSREGYRVAVRGFAGACPRCGLPIPGVWG